METQSFPFPRLRVEPCQQDLPCKVNVDARSPPGLDCIREIPRPQPSRICNTVPLGNT